MNETQASPKKRARWLGLLVKGPMGCLAFFVGLSLVFVVFGPGALGSLFASSVEEHFSLNHAGSLEVQEAWIGSLVGPQSIKGIVVKAPNGDEVLRARLDAPSFATLLNDEADAHWGPVIIALDDIDLREDADGRTSLGYAMELTSPASESSLARLDAQFAFESLLVEFVVGRLSYTDRMERVVVLHDLNLQAHFNGTGSAVGMKAWGTATVEGGEPGGVLFQCTVANVCTNGSSRSAWTMGLDGTGIPIALLEVLFTPVSGLAKTLGEELLTCRIRVSSDAEAQRHVDELHLTTDLLEVELAARWEPEQNRLVSGQGDWARFRLLDSDRGRSLVQDVVPLVENIEVEPVPHHVEIRLTDFVLPIAGEVEDVSASCALDAGAWAFRYVDPLHERVILEQHTRARGPIQFRLEERRLWYDELTLPGRGGDVLVSGSYSLEDGRYGLIVILPDHAAYELTGDRGQLVIESTLR